MTLANSGHRSVRNLKIWNLTWSVGSTHEFDDLKGEASLPQHVERLVHSVELDTSDGVCAHYISNPSNLLETSETRLTVRHESHFVHDEVSSWWLRGMLDVSFGGPHAWVHDFLGRVDRAEVFQVSRIRALSAYVEDFRARLG